MTYRFPYDRTVICLWGGGGQESVYFDVLHMRVGEMTVLHEALLRSVLATNSRQGLSQGISSISACGNTGCLDDTAARFR